MHGKWQHTPSHDHSVQYSNLNCTRIWLSLPYLTTQGYQFNINLTSGYDSSCHDDMPLRLVSSKTYKHISQTYHCVLQKSIHCECCIIWDIDQLHNESIQTVLSGMLFDAQDLTESNILSKNYHDSTQFIAICVAFPASFWTEVECWVWSELYVHSINQTQANVLFKSNHAILLIRCDICLVLWTKFCVTAMWSDTALLMPVSCPCKHTWTSYKECRNSAVENLCGFYLKPHMGAKPELFGKKRVNSKEYVTMEGQSRNRLCTIIHVLLSASSRHAFVKLHAVYIKTQLHTLCFSPNHHHVPLKLCADFQAQLDRYNLPKSVAPSFLYSTTSKPLGFVKSIPSVTSWSEILEKVWHHPDYDPYTCHKGKDPQQKKTG